MRRIATDLIGASMSSIILSILNQGDSYGYEMIHKVKEYTNGEVEWHEVGVYPILKKLEKEGMIKSYWNMNEGKRPRKYYNIKDEGVKQLQVNKYEWGLVERLYKKLWNPE